MVIVFYSSKVIEIDWSFNHFYFDENRFGSYAIQCWYLFLIIPLLRNLTWDFLFKSNSLSAFGSIFLLIIQFIIYIGYEDYERYKIVRIHQLNKVEYSGHNN